MAALKFFFSLFMIPVSLFLAGLAIVAYMAGSTSPQESMFITFSGLAVPFILIINLILCSYWIIRKKWWFLVPLTAILLNIGFLTSIFQISFSSPKIPEGRTPIRIASYNVGKFKSWEKFSTQYPIIDFLKNDNVNIICFQEYMENAQINADTLNKLLNFPYHSIKHLQGSTTLGIGIFSKYPILQSGRIPLNSTTNDAMWADVKIGEETIRIITCHMQTTNFSRKQKDLNDPVLRNADIQQVETVVQGVAEELTKNFKIRAQQADIIRQMIDTTRIPIILCGDFNDTPASYTYHRIKGDMKDSFKERGNGYAYTFRGLHRLLRIDFIFYSPAFKCVDYDSPEREWSDHNPVISEFYLK